MCALRRNVVIVMYQKVVNHLLFKGKPAHAAGGDDLNQRGLGHERKGGPRVLAQDTTGLDVTMPTRRPPRTHGPDERAVRCLQIVNHTYCQRTTSLTELARVTGETKSVVERDIALLKDGGLQLAVDARGECRIDQRVPGFSLRLTIPEAYAAWAKLAFCSHCRLAMGDAISSEATNAASKLLADGLRQYYPETDRAQVGHFDCGAGPPALPIDATKSHGWEHLGGEARRACKRLWMHELIETGRGRKRDELATLIDISDRTVGYDINVVRKAGLHINFLRDKRRYSVDTLHTYLEAGLTADDHAPIGAALLAMFAMQESPEQPAALRPWCVAASRKMEKSLRLIYRRRTAELDDYLRTDASPP